MLRYAIRRSVITAVLVLITTLAGRAQVMGIGQTSLQLGQSFESAQKSLTTLGYELQLTPGADDITRYIVKSDSALVGALEARKGKLISITRTLANDEENYTTAYEVFILALHDARLHGMHQTSTDVRDVQTIGGYRCTRLTVLGDGHFVHLYSKDRDGTVLFTVCQEVALK